MSAKPSRSLKRMSREELILLIRDLTLENETLKAERFETEANSPAPGEQLRDPALAEELRSLRGSVETLRESFDDWGEDFARAVRSVRGANGESRR